MKLTTLCYIERKNTATDKEEYLMLHRNKKEKDMNKGKWLGIGGKFEENESPQECMLRETLEETGLEILRYRFRGIITFVSDEWETEYMHLFTAQEFQGRLIDCLEGDLQWIEKKQILSLPMWEGDSIFLKKLMNNDEFFSLKLRYSGEKLLESKLL